MNARAYVLIFFFWAVLTIVTPTLIILSESSKADFDQNGKFFEVMKPRKMMAYIEKHPRTPDSLARKKLPELAPAPAPGPSPSPSPAPAPSPALSPAETVKSALRIVKLFRKQ
ncbi:hypothetical protein ACOSQ4_011081 [Xanthoceras sorbifolium]